ncbi:uncharacterized protein LOC120069065 [Benincasa hispida]|uniref:uncharacterized protein LOC120069065 n=1 Tax=Benincasa hispida TaxID=102211 RepID=UPI0019010B95|nr:uncharacterized protein LOC120069065 [Benincasa hispida]
MEKNTNTNANANANTNTVSETSPDQHHDGERTPITATSPLPPARNDNVNNPTPTVVIELSSSIVVAAPESATTGDSRRRQIVDATLLDVETSSHEYIGGSSNIEQGKKRGKGDGEEQQQQVRVAKKKGELTEVPKGEPKCATCNKVFKSWKALFGHLRSHPERTYRGALPPPTAAELDIHQQLASTLLTVAQQVAASRRGLDIDLNQPSTADDGDLPEKTGGVGFDLNIKPPSDSDDEK